MFAKYDEPKPPPGLPKAFGCWGIDPARRRESNADCCAADKLAPRPEGCDGDDDGRFESIGAADGEGREGLDWVFVGTPRLPKFWDPGKRDGTVPARLRRMGAADCCED